MPYYEQLTTEHDTAGIAGQAFAKLLDRSVELEVERSVAERMLEQARDDVTRLTSRAEIRDKEIAHARGTIVNQKSLYLELRRAAEAVWDANDDPGIASVKKGSKVGRLIADLGQVLADHSTPIASLDSMDIAAGAKSVAQ